MNNMKIPTRPAPSIEEATKRPYNGQKNPLINFSTKKKPPPRPPPPNFTKEKSKSTWNLNAPSDNTVSLIEWSPPNTPKTNKHTFGGSISSSFSSSTSSLASSKKSFEYETVSLNNQVWGNNSPFQFPAYGLQSKPAPTLIPAPEPPKVGPTIIRAQGIKKPRQINETASRSSSPNYEQINICVSPPMPAMPPPSPPKEIEDIVTPFGIVLFDYLQSHSDDLQLHVNDIVYLIRKINDDWFYGRIDDKEGIFPANYIDVQVPLQDDIVVVLYDFRPQMPNDLNLKAGQNVKVIKRISEHWLWGESNGKQGQFPSNYVDRVPQKI